MPKTKPRRIASFDEHVMGAEPFFKVQPTKLELIQAYSWYNYMLDVNEGAEFVHEYIRTNKLPPLSGIQGWEIGATACWIARMILNGSAVPPDSRAFLEQRLRDLYARAKKRQAIVGALNPNATPPVSVAVRNKRIVAEYNGAVDEFLDMFYRDEIDDFDLYMWLKDNDVKPKQASMIAGRIKELLQELQSNDPQLVEARRHMSKARIKHYVAFYGKLIDDAERWARGSKLPRKPRKGKKRLPKPAALKASKVQYQQRDDDLKIVSEDPSKIVGAQQVFVYNTKRKQMTCYFAQNEAGLDISRSSIRNYDEKASGTKRLRKPKQTIDLVAEQAKKTAAATFMKVKAKQSAASGRINANTIILKVYK